MVIEKGINVMRGNFVFGVSSVWFFMCIVLFSFYNRIEIVSSLGWKLRVGFLKLDRFLFEF